MGTLESRDKRTIRRISDVPSIWAYQANLNCLIQDFIPAETVNLLSAESGTGKSWVAYAIAGAVANGQPFAGQTVQKRPVAYFDGENPVAVVKDRLNALGISQTPGLHVWGGWVGSDDQPPRPDDPMVVEFAQEENPLLIWDSLVEFNPGDEMDATQMRAFMKKFRRLANIGATVLVLHHTGKTATAQDYRGSSDIKAGVDTAYRLDSLQQRDGKIHRLGLVNFKSRAAAGNDLGLEFSPGEGFARYFVSARKKKDTAALLKAIIEEKGSINGTMLKDLAKENCDISKHAVDKFLEGWPHRRKSARGNEILYYSKPEALFPAA